MSSSGSSDHFTYDATPSVTGITPVAGPIAGGTVVTITGTGFADASGASFAGNASSFTIVSDTSITATSPAGTAGTVDITVTNETGTSSTSSADHFTYDSTPSVTGITPVAGPIAGGTVVTITGTGFVVGSSTAKFGTSSGTSVSCSSSTSCTATSPGESAGVVDVTVTTPGGMSSSGSSDHFTYDATPSVTGITPVAGPIAGGTVVTITGTGFSGASSVDFGTIAAASYTINSSTSITATSPTVSVGPVDVKITTPGGTSATGSADQFTYESAPSITAISPVAGLSAGGTAVTITGTSFADASEVSFGTTLAASYTVVSPTEITATSPAQSASTVDLTVTTPIGTSAINASDRFTYGATITGTVIDAIEPRGLAGVCVYATSSDGNSGQATTAFDGGYSIIGLPADSYTVRFDPTCDATVPTPDLQQWYDDATTQLAASLVTVTAGEETSGIDAALGVPTAAVPDAPTNVTATAADASATVTWTVPADNGRTISSYSVTAADSTTAANGAQSCTADGESAASCTVSGLTNGDSYTFTVTATNAIGTGPASSASNAVIPMAVPGAPTKIRATMSKGASSAAVSWTAPSSSGGSPITGYLAKASGSGGQACTTTGATSCTVTRLASGASYTFTVVATNSIGTSPVSTASNPVSSRTLSAVAFSLSAKKVTNRGEQTERLSVSVSGFNAKNLATPAGTVMVSEPTKKLCVITLSSGRGSCQLTADELGVGTYKLVATYSGSKLYAASTRAQQLIVRAAPVTTTLFELSHSSVRYGHEQIENLTAITTTVRAGSPIGNVVLKVGSRVLCVITLKDDIGSCRLSPRQLGVGTYQITADYLGNMVFSPSLTTTELAVLR
jgi:hypothetical protein